MQPYLPADELLSDFDVAEDDLVTVVLGTAHNTFTLFTNLYIITTIITIYKIIVSTLQKMNNEHSAVPVLPSVL